MTRTVLGENISRRTDAQCTAHTCPCSNYKIPHTPYRDAHREEGLSPSPTGTPNASPSSPFETSDAGVHMRECARETSPVSARVRCDGGFLPVDGDREHQQKVVWRERDREEGRKPLFVLTLAPFA